MNTASSRTAATTPSPSLLPDFLAGMQPAFFNQRTGEAHLSQTEDGFPALEYGFSGLPDDWVVERDPDGKATALHPDVIAGYWRDARFVALSQIGQMPLDA
ncbi:hypothetical protein ACUNV4_28615 [Granulosicoccus sp. 3-233]|uniref:hypothetical protein n=1 Tax=Granulosicoccus sp. 3-233 TaxID=3417969 RepID=UPI003D345EA4